MTASRSPPPKRVKLESPPTTFIIKSEPDAPDDPQFGPEELEEEEEDEDRCSICLQEVVDRTIVPVCAHEFCFDCIIVWTEQSRRCPLCSQGTGPFLIHNIRSRFDYQKHYLNPLPSSPVPLQPLPLRVNRAHRRRPRESRQWGRRDRAESDEADRFEQSVAKRKWIYEHDLYAKHVASNAYTRYRPYPTPAQFAASPDLISRTTTFLRRELQVWVNLDVEFLTSFTLSIMKAIDIRSESAVKLLSEFLDLDAPYVEGGRHVNAEHFAHEIYSYVRSPYKDLFVYDSVVQYEITPDILLPVEEPRRRWREASCSRSPAGSARDPRAEGARQVHDIYAEETRRLRSRSRSPSRLRSGRRRTSSRDRELDEHTSRGSGRQQERITSRHRQSNEYTNPGDTGIGAEQTGAPIQYNHTDCPPPGPAAATENTGTLNSKGNPRSTPSEEVSVLQEESATGTVVSPIPVASRKPSRIRNRSLFESVQAHLAGPSRKREVKAVQDSAPDSSDTFNEETKSVPSSLIRLSDPRTLEPIHNSATSGSSLSATTEVLQDTASELLPQQDPLPDPRSFSAPEIMARTRARLAKLAPPRSLSLHGNVPASLSLGGNSDISTTENIGSSESPRRTRLLSRLEEEKRNALGGAAQSSSLDVIAEPAAVTSNVVALDRISQPEIASPSDTLSGEFSRTVENVDAVESRLRRQAQLRVRLAAEKRKHPSTAP
ncbi:E3 ubiquitin-protein ligase Topors [Mycena sanguinolenta]|uniref:RING-type E3 ubiquitin transferase n=1 Tax=Mycena sanguinolenta TaxID=230812 RepID=A0A8H7CML6_9AGAR|nr:E3 ubiquitin-protein ligase Topors [Mycena sanguinolenta]